MPIDDPRNQAKLRPFSEIDALIKQWVNDVAEDVYESGTLRVSPIENQSRDGFFPYTEGGWNAIIHDDLYSCNGSGNVPTLLRATLASELKDCAEEWDRQNPEIPYAELFDSTVEDEGQQPLLGFAASKEADAKREKYYEFENAYMQEGNTFFWKVRVLYYDTDNSRNETGKPEVLFCVGLNDDFEYGRSHVSWLASPGKGGPGDHWLWEKTVPVEDVTDELLGTLKGEAIAALGAA